MATALESEPSHMSFSGAPVRTKTGVVVVRRSVVSRLASFPLPLVTYHPTTVHQLTSVPNSK